MNFLRLNCKLSRIDKKKLGLTNYFWKWPDSKIRIENSFPTTITIIVSYYKIVNNINLRPELKTYRWNKKQSDRNEVFGCAVSAHYSD